MVVILNTCINGYFNRWTRDVFYVHRVVGEFNENSKSKCIHHIYIYLERLSFYL